ncbi:MAG: response regulator transcription factor [Anaerolineales bacterium]|uniref:response regulator n=1 Tax=Candidatus Villigracilis proximus TaxID=3140683 RepID=UPI0031361F04|nr:response regulator transcription factor [Anaerolineales bacterium]
MKKIKVMITDDHPMMREALRTALEDEPDMLICCEASNGADAVVMAGEHCPDVILMDLLMAEMDGLEAIRKILEKDPQAHIMVVTSLEDEDKVIAAVQAGALGSFPQDRSAFVFNGRDPQSGGWGALFTVWHYAKIDERSAEDENRSIDTECSGGFFDRAAGGDSGVVGRRKNRCTD